MSCIIDTKSQASLTGWEIHGGHDCVALVLGFDDGTEVTLDTAAVGELLAAVPALQKDYSRAMLMATLVVANPLIRFVDPPRTGAADLLRDREGQS